MRHLWEAALNVLYPPACCACGAGTNRPGFCAACLRRISTPQSPLCPTCGLPFSTSGDADHLCGQCLQRRPCFGRARACTVYDAGATADHPLKLVLQRYKYNRAVSLARPLAELLAKRAPFAVADYDAVIPVPLHIERLRWRGFNQAQLLVRTVAARERVPIDPFSLRRTRSTPPQVQLNETERRHNVTGAFSVVRPRRVRGRRILLTDDVYTTGATVRECSRVLLRAGATQVDVLVLARAVLR
ncbi:MAG: ComF family protein [Candidatus Binatia bacterium]